MTRQPPSASGDNEGLGSLLFLALFILLLAFFILLNAMSSFQERKVGEVLRSVDDAFSLTRNLFGREGDDDRDAALAEAARVLAAIGEMAPLQVGVIRVEKPGQGDTLVVVMALDRLIDPVSLRPRADQAGFLHRIADSLAPRAGGVHIQAEILLADGGDRAIVQAGAIARILSGLGAPLANLTVGVEAGTAGQMRFLMTLQDPRAPGVRLVRNGGGA